MFFCENSLPLLIRVDDLQWLKDLQKGNIFMRHMWYYQYGDVSDKARIDKYDGCLPTYGFVDVKPSDGQLVSNGKYTENSAYIKSFMFLDGHDYCLKNDRVILCPKQSIIEQVLNLNKKYILIISLLPFITQFESSCKKQGIIADKGQIEYLDKASLLDLIQEYNTYIQNYTKGLSVSRPSKRLSFCKPLSFKNQQEYRLCINDSSAIKQFISYHNSISYINKQNVEAIKNSFKIINIGTIENISTIIPISQFINL